MRGIVKKIFGDPNDKAIKQLMPLVQDINGLEPSMRELSDEELMQVGAEFRRRYNDEGESLDESVAEAFAATREASKRVRGQRHFDVQLIGGVVLHEGKIAEMKTGEGKTLTATLAVALNAISGKGVHLVTVNDYLAKRDTQWMGEIYHLLGFSIGCLQHDSSFLFDPDFPAEDERMVKLRPVERREAYAADITYGTNNEFGFDYLRDNMVVEIEQVRAASAEFRDRRRGRQHPDRRSAHAADHLGRRPSRQPIATTSSRRSCKQLRAGRDYEVDLKHRSATLTEEGIDRVERLAGIRRARASTTSAISN